MILIIILFSETVGLYLFYAKLNVPQDRFNAALWVYHFSVLGCCISVLRIPYNAVIIAYEKMSFYAYISIMEAILKLLAVYLLLVVKHDKLILYSILMFIVLLAVNIIYKYFCNRKFVVTHYKPFWDFKLYKELIGFSGWSMLGSIANVGANQGVNLVLNIFCGILVNTAMGITHQVHVAINTFIANFQTAFVPQIIKSYAEGNRTYFLSLFFRTSRYSYFLIFLIGFPLILCCKELLGFWLGRVPEYAVEFTRLIVVFCIIDAIAGPLWNSVQATGKIRNYQIFISILIFMNVPVAFLLLFLDFSPISVLLLKVILNLITLLVRILFLRRLIDFSITKYLREVILKILIVTFCIIPVPVCFKLMGEGSVLHFIMTIVLAELVSIVMIYNIGLTGEEKNMLSAKLQFCWIKYFPKRD